MPGDRTRAHPGLDRDGRRPSRTALRSSGREAAIVYTSAEPSLTTEKARALGIKEVIGEFTAGGFATTSGENIRLVAEKISRGKGQRCDRAAGRDLRAERVHRN